MKSAILLAEKTLPELSAKKPYDAAQQINISYAVAVHDIF
jgi:hypothetical protein